MTEHEPDPDSLVGSIFDHADYRDRFRVEVPVGQYGSVDEVVDDWFTSQSSLIRLLSTNTLSLKTIDEATGHGYDVGSKIGSWKVVERDASEIVFGEPMGFMEYRYSLRLVERGNTAVEGSTAVKYLWRRTGKYYFALARPLHRRFIKRGLKAATSRS